jgi:hypothetical protein
MVYPLFFFPFLFRILNYSLVIFTYLVKMPTNGSICAKLVSGPFSVQSQIESSVLIFFFFYNIKL